MKTRFRRCDIKLWWTDGGAGASSTRTRFVSPSSRTECPWRRWKGILCILYYQYLLIRKCSLRPFQSVRIVPKKIFGETRLLLITHLICCKWVIIQSASRSRISQRIIVKHVFHYSASQDEPSVAAGSKKRNQGSKHCSLWKWSSNRHESSGYSQDIHVGW